MPDLHIDADEATRLMLDSLAHVPREDRPRALELMTAALTYTMNATIEACAVKVEGWVNCNDANVCLVAREIAAALRACKEKDE